VADFFHEPKKILCGREADAAFAKAGARDYFGMKFVVVSEEEMLSDSDLSSWAHQAFPFVRIPLQLAREKNFDASAKKIPGGGIARTQWLEMQSAAASVEARGKDAGVIEDNQVAGAQELGEVAEVSIIYWAEPGVSRRAINVQEARGRPVGQRFLRNQFFGESVIEVGDPHGF